MWRFRRDDAKTGAVLLEHVGPDVTVEFREESSPPRVLPGMRHDVVPWDERPTPPEWGSYRQRGVAQGVPIMVRRLSRGAWVQALWDLRDEGSVLAAQCWTVWRRGSEHAQSRARQRQSAGNGTCDIRC